MAYRVESLLVKLEEDKKEEDAVSEEVEWMSG